MLKRIAGSPIVFMVIFWLSVVQANAQEAVPRKFPVVEFYAGYSYANVSLGSQSAVFAPAGRSYNGVQFDTKLNVRRHLGLVLDLAQEIGHSTIADPIGHEAHMRIYTAQFLAGSELTLRTAKFNVFVDTLCGLTHTSLNVLSGYSFAGYADSPDYSALADRTNLAFGAGGGIERNVNEHVALRVLDADYIPSRIDGQWESNIRVGTGVILKF
jgi:opacity protein-like surface antigen